ncbi:MAG: glycosyltransferase family 39 protein [Candidatus Levybacteria bacterium]|nr:glycosyltransferase family 39 protein [Candidatus Levybacteria bacterium]
MKLLAKAEKNKDIWFLIKVSFIFFLLRLPSLFEPNWYGDEGIYQVLGTGIRAGRLLYKEVFDNKPPLLYLIYAIFNSDQFAVRLASLVFGILALILFFLLAKKLFNQNGEGRKTVFIATSVFGLLFALPLLEGNIANAENFMLFPIITAGFLIFSFREKILQSKKSNKILFVSGFLLGLSFLFKIVGAFDFVAFLVFIILINLPHKLAFKSSDLKNYFSPLVKPILYFVSGFSAPIFITTIYFFINGALGDLLIATFVQNVGYVGYGNKLFIPQGFLILKLLLLIGFLVFLFSKRAKFSKTTLFVLAWFAFSLFNAYFSQRPYTHYVLVLIPSFSLLIGLVLWDKKYQIFNLVLLMISLLFIFKDFNFYTKIIPYYQNFSSFIMSTNSISSYQAFFDRKTPTDYEVAQFIKSKTTSKDNIFIWGNNAQLYTLTNKLPPGKYTVAYHITYYKDGAKNTYDGILKTKPKFIIVMPSQNMPPIPLANYNKNYDINNVLIYERIF